jgi:hypothetical protein
MHSPEVSSGNRRLKDMERVRRVVRRQGRVRAAKRRAEIGDSQLEMLKHQRRSRARRIRRLRNIVVCTAIQSNIDPTSIASVMPIAPTQ